MTLAYLSHLKNLKLVSDEIANGTEPTTWHLAALAGVCRRQVHRYIKTLREFGAPLPVSHKRHMNGFRFTRVWNFEDALIRWLRKTR